MRVKPTDPETLADLIRLIPAAVALFDIEMRYMAVSDQWCKNYGHTEADIVGRSHYDVFPEIPERWREIHRRNLSGEELSQDEDPFHRADGTVDYMRWRNVPWRNQDGSIGGIIMLTENITDLVMQRRRAQIEIVELQASREALRREIEASRSELEDNRIHLATFIDNLPGGAFRCLLDEHWTMLFMSEGCQRLTGYPIEDMILNKVISNNDIIHPNDRQELRDIIGGAAALGRQYEATYRITTKSGEQKYVLEKGIQVASAENGAPVIQGLMLDITDRKKAEFARERALEEARRADRAKSEFLATMSHELRTPLNAISGFSEMIKSQAFGKIGNDKYLEYAEHIQSSGEHLLSLINDVLDLSKIEAGEMVIAPRSFSLQPALEEAASLLKPLDGITQRRVVIDLAQGIDEIYADLRSFRQVLINILSNANKFSPPDAEIRIHCSRGENDALEIAIVDQGIGIPEADLGRVLEPFGQSRKNADVTHEGTGLGLSLSKQLMELHGGWLKLESDVNKGTTVRVAFPLATQDA